MKRSLILRVAIVLMAPLIFLVVLVGNIDRLFPHAANLAPASSNSSQTEKTDRESTDNARYLRSISAEGSDVVKEDFLEALRRGLNDGRTKSDAYFTTRRYIDNSGDIYELYDYVNDHPELAFLREAEAIAPQAFDLIRKRKLPFGYTDYGLYAYLAYAEVLEKHGYANVALLGTVTNLYSQMAYYKTDTVREKQQGNPLIGYPDYPQSEIEGDMAKALAFAAKAEREVSEILKNGRYPEGHQSIDIVYGTEQFASALRYLEALNIDTSGFSSSRDVFALAIKHSHNDVPELYLRVALSNAVTMMVSGSSNQNELRNALYPFFDIRDTKDKQRGIVDKMIRSRVEGNVTRWHSLLVIYSHRNVSALGNKVPEFKSWLISNGWKESDF